MNFKGIVNSSLDVTKNISKDLYTNPYFMSALSTLVVIELCDIYINYRAKKYEEDLHRQYQKYRREYERNKEERMKDYEERKKKNSKDNELLIVQFEESCGAEYIKFAKLIIDEIADLINSQEISELEKCEYLDIINRHSAWINKSPEGYILLPASNLSIVEEMGDLINSFGLTDSEKSKLIEIIQKH